MDVFSSTILGLLIFSSILNIVGLHVEQWSVTDVQKGRFTSPVCLSDGLSVSCVR